MKKLYLFTLIASVPMAVMAQNVEVPMFDDDMPKLGRQAKPLDHIVVTPSQLPEIRVDIDDTLRKPLQDKGKEKPVADDKKENVEELEKPVIPEKVSVDPIKFNEGYSHQKTQEMNDRLSMGIVHYQQEKAKAELERKIAAQKAEIEKQKAQQKKEQKGQEKKSEEAGVPDSIKDLFGQTSDVHTFDISGIELGMTPDEVLEKATDHGYRVTKVEHGIPLHRTSYYNAVCRESGLKRLDAIQNCIIDQAETDDVYYVSSMTLAKDDTAEYMRVLFSTKATDNVSYKIYYENKGDNSLNFTRRNLAKKLRRRDAFIKMLYDTYGAPDDKDQMVWGDFEKSYMKAQMQGSSYNAYLVLEDKEIPTQDWVDADDRKDELKYRHTFTFGVDGE